MAKVHFPRTGGQEWVDSFYRPASPTGNVLWVDSTNGTATGPGYSPETAYNSIHNASAACTADNGDTIYCLPGGTETVTAAAGLALAKAGVTVIGLGRGRQRYKVLFTTAVGASCDITAARVVVQNLVFVTGFDAQTAMINISAADVVIEDCEIETATSSFQAVLGILTTAAADRLILRNNFIHGSLNAGTTTQVSLVGGDAIQILDNTIIGACTTSAGVIANATTDSTNLVIHANRLNNTTASSTKAIVLTSGSTGFITNNRIAILSGTAPVTAAAMNVGGNVYSAAAGITAGTASTI